MDETQLLSLIAEGEGNKMDFKREINLSTARDKSEFVKDVISIANSNMGNGYILVGDDNNKNFVGITSLGWVLTKIRKKI